MRDPGAPVPCVKDNPSTFYVHSYVPSTEEPPNNDHIGDKHFGHYSDLLGGSSKVRIVHFMLITRC